MPKYIPKPETNMYYIIKEENRNLSEELEEYLKQVVILRGNMDMMGNSIEILLNGTLDKIGIRPELTFGRKTEQLKENKLILIKYITTFDDLVQNLRRFNENWIITKHGITVMGTTKDITLFKDDGLYIFDKNEIKEINQEFNQIQKVLIKIL